MNKTKDSFFSSLLEVGLNPDRLTIPAPDSDSGFLVLYPGSTRVRVMAPAGDQYTAFKPSQSKRGEVREFSDKSRRRLMGTLSTIHRKAEARAITLTFAENLKDAKQAKRCLHAFFERVRVSYPRVGIIWKLEFQERGASHFHMLAWGGWIDKDWLDRTWDRIQQENRHGRPSVSCRIEWIGPIQRAGRYLLKYLGKSFERQLGESSIGRVWGIHQRDNVPFADPEYRRIDAEGARAILSFWSDRIESPYRLNSFDIFLTVEQAEELERLIHDST